MNSANHIPLRNENVAICIAGDSMWGGYDSRAPLFGRSPVGADFSLRFVCSQVSVDVTLLVEDGYTATKLSDYGPVTMDMNASRQTEAFLHQSDKLSV